MQGTHDSDRSRLQRRREQGLGSSTRATAFDALNSSRRETMTREVAALQRDFVGQSAEEGVDHLAAFPERKDWAVLTSDGHEVEHACHAGDGRHAHEWPAFRAGIRDMGADTRVSVEDRGFTDPPTWDCFRRRGVHRITGHEENMYPVQETDLPFDRAEPVNAGLRGVPGVFLLIICRDPESGEAYTFLSSLPEGFRPGMLAWICFLRWSIEKLCDTFKNQIHEAKAWATSPAAAALHPLLVSVAYNRMLCLQHRLHRDIGIADEKVERKFRAYIQQRFQAAAAAHRHLHPLYTIMPPHRRVPMSAPSIRCGSNLLHSARPRPQLPATLRNAQRRHQLSTTGHRWPLACRNVAAYTAARCCISSMFGEALTQHDLRTRPSLRQASGRFSGLNCLLFTHTGRFNAAAKKKSLLNAQG